MLKKLPPKARKAFLVEDIPHNLVAVSELVDAGCSVHMYDWGFDIDLEGETIYKGWREGPHSRLFRMSLTDDNVGPIQPPADPSEWDPNSRTVCQAVQFSANNIYECQNKEQLLRYYHASLASHPKRVLAAAAKAGYLQGCPGLTAEAINKFIDVEDATEMGHMRQQPAGTRSTTKITKRGRPAMHTLERDAAAQDATATPEQEPSNSRTKKVFMTVQLADGWIASDQTGAFPRVSNRGNKYISVFYVYDANHVKGIPLKSRHRSELLKAYETVYKWCEARGFKPELHRMDNETSADVEDFIRSQGTKLQYSSPGRHCKPAERAVQTYKCCFKSITASLPKAFPIAYWCRLLEQCDLAVNIVRPHRQNPRLSAWAAMEGEYFFEATPIAPPGSAMLMQVKPGERPSWGHNAKKAWYVGPCFKHYRSFKGALPSTKGERISDSVKFQHHAIAIPELTPGDRILEATRQLKDAINNQPKRAPMDELRAIELLQEVMLGKGKQELPLNSVQQRRATRRAEMPPAPVVCEPKHSAVPTPQSTVTDAAPPEPANYVSDDEDDDPQAATSKRRSRRIQSQRQPDKYDTLHRIVALAAKETATVPELAVHQRKLTMGYHCANLSLQLDEWAHDFYFAGAIIDETTGEKMEYRDLIKRPELMETWYTSLANELGRLAQGIRDVKGTDTVDFIQLSEIPMDRRKEITYGRIVVAYKPDKIEQARSRLTVGGNLIWYPFDKSAPTSDLPTIKLLWNSVLSCPGAKYFTMDISNFYLNSPLPRPEYMRLPVKIIPAEIMQHYNLADIAENGWVYMRINKGMYGLPQAGKLANDLLVKRMQTAGYHPCQVTPGLWKHVWRPVVFTLVVDDFGIKFEGDEHANHLKKTLERWYDITVDWKGQKYVGISLEWDYDERTLHTSVPGYVQKSLKKFGHPKPAKPQHAPAKAAPIQYGAKVQEATPDDTSPQLTPDGIKRIQEIVGTFGWYARASDPTMEQTLSSIAGRQSNATQQLRDEVVQFLDYCATHPDAKVRFHASDMLLTLHSDGSYLSEPNSKSRAAGHFYLSNKKNHNLNNGAILTLSKIIKHVMGSAGEAEIASLYYNCKNALPLRTALMEMGHPQPKTPAVTDSATSEGLINKTMTPKRAKTYDQRFNWLKCREAQKQFDIIWQSGKDNLADFHSKKHPIHVYKSKRTDYVTNR